MFGYYYIILGNGVLQLKYINGNGILYSHSENSRLIGYCDVD